MSPDDTLQPVDDDPVTYGALAVILAVCIALLSGITVPYPLSSTPYTLETLGVYFGGLVLGPVWVVVGLGLYLVAYATNLAFFGPPVGSGMDVLTGPLAGYVLTYPLAGGVVGAIVHRDVYPKPLDRISIPYQVGALGVGVLLVYPVGAVWLGLSTPFSLGGAVFVGGLSYLPGEAAKAAVALGLAVGGYYALDHLCEE